MEPMRAVPAVVVGGQRVTERRDGKSKRDQAEAFRRALQQESSAQKEGAEAGEPDAGQVPMRRPLQVGGASGRKSQETARHVEVIA